VEPKDLIREEMDFQQRRFYRRLKVSGKLVVEFWPGAKKFLNSIPGISWKMQGNKILITEKITTMKSYREILQEEYSDLKTAKKEAEKEYRRKGSHQAVVKMKNGDFEVQRLPDAQDLEKGDKIVWTTQKA
jgi:hypothetical protein